MLLIYWTLSSVALLDIINSDGLMFPSWLFNILYPGYFLGLILAYVGSSFFALLGQIITLAVVLLIYLFFNKLFKYYNKEK